MGWHDEKVSSLQLAAPLSILPHLSVEQAITIMNEEGYDQLPVIDEMGKIEGVATLGSLKAKVLKGKVMPTDAVDKATYHMFKKVTLDTCLEKLDRILDKVHFAFVVHSQRLFKSPNDVQNKEVIVGVVTDVDLLHYVTQNETAKLQSISESTGASTNSGHSTPEPI